MPTENSLDSSDAIGYYIGDSCNVMCAHCATNSSPKISNISGQESVIDELVSAISNTSLVAVHVSGGEPFVHIDSLYHLVITLKNAGIKAWVNTNGYWATSIDAAISVLSEKIPYISRVYLSTDAYHQVFIPLERIATAATAAVSLGIEVVVCIATTSAAEQSELSKVYKALGKQLKEQVETVTFPLESAGRASNLPEAQWREQTLEPPAGLCHQLHQPVVMHDGQVSACCNTVVSKSLPSSPLWLGSIEMLDIDAVLHGEYNDPLLWGVRNLGPAAVLELVHDIEVKSNTYRDGNVCDVCTTIMSDEALVSKARRACQKIKDALHEFD